MSYFYYPQLNAVFIHIPKTGGWSIRNGALSAMERDGPSTEWREEWDSAFKFAFVRHPVDRFLSAYRMVTQGTNDMDARLFANPVDMSVGEFIDRAMFRKCDPNDLSDLDGFIVHHTLPMSHPYNGIEKADFVGRFETLADDWAKVAWMLGGVQKHLPMLNWTQKADEEVSPWLAKMLADYYAEDFERFGYDL